ncbi:hypothetical protein ACP70R_043339 [Stipagrostis hirtigluma subsp. patula]
MSIIPWAQRRRGHFIEAQLGVGIWAKSPLKVGKIANYSRGEVSQPPDAPAPLRLSLRSNSTSTLVDEEPDSPTSPSCLSPDGYSPLIRYSSVGEHEPPPLVGNGDAYYNPIGSYTSCAMDAFQSIIQDNVPLDTDDLEYGDLYPATYSFKPSIDVQSIEFAEAALQHHNNDPNNEVKYELIEAIMSTYMLEGASSYGHVNFTARANQEGSEEQLFFAELELQGDITFLTCLRCLKEKGDQVGGLMYQTERTRGIDLEHCYACCDGLKHPRDGASYQAGHGTPRFYEGA